MIFQLKSEKPGPGPATQAVLAKGTNGVISSVDYDSGTRELFLYFSNRPRKILTDVSPDIGHAFLRSEDLDQFYEENFASPAAMR